MRYFLVLFICLVVSCSLTPEGKPIPITAPVTALVLSDPMLTIANYSTIDLLYVKAVINADYFYFCPDLDVWCAMDNTYNNFGMKNGSLKNRVVKAGEVVISFYISSDVNFKTREVVQRFNVTNGGTYWFTIDGDTSIYTY